MKKMIVNIALLSATIAVLGLTGLFLSNRFPISVNIARLDVEEMAAQKEAAAQAAKAAQRRAQLNRTVSCKADEDCIIVDKDPCGCAAGPRGVTAINVNYITDFNAINSQPSTKTCMDVPSTEKECSPSARAVCRARTCRIEY